MAKQVMNEAMELVLIKEQMKQLDDQMKRILSHIESEQRVSVNQGKLIDQIKSSMDTQTELLKMNLQNQQRMVDNHQLILLNSGKGLTYEVDRLKQRINNSKEAKAYNIALFGLIISILGVLASLLMK